MISGVNLPLKSLALEKHVVDAREFLAFLKTREAWKSSLLELSIKSSRTTSVNNWNVLKSFKHLKQLSVYVTSQQEFDDILDTASSLDLQSLYMVISYAIRPTLTFKALQDLKSMKHLEQLQLVCAELLPDTGKELYLLAEHIATCPYLRYVYLPEFGPL
jgi:hypothetical protein